MSAQYLYFWDTSPYGITLDEPNCTKKLNWRIVLYSRFISFLYISFSFLILFRINNSCKQKTLYPRLRLFVLMGKYVLRCAGCNETAALDQMSCKNDAGLLRTHYVERYLQLQPFPGIWKFLCWLPVDTPLAAKDDRNVEIGDCSISFRSHRLARELGLADLTISFSGYWPERGAGMRTCSFKELEAAPTMKRLMEVGDGAILVVASAGNTARAFAEVAARTGQTLVLFVPESSLYRLWTTFEAKDHNICLVGVKGDYFDAISAAQIVSSSRGFVPEGGARNVARRDGMGTVVLEAAEKRMSVPSHYFQAVGSGTGGIAAWEAAIRLRADGRTPCNGPQGLPRLHLAQNVPCAPIYRAWAGKEKDAEDYGSIACSEGMYDDVLFNRKPPYEVPGGVKDALDATNGIVYGISNSEAEGGRKLFEESEGIDILPAAAVAVAALQKAVASGEVNHSESVLLNITGGGFSRAKEDLTIIQLDAEMRLDPSSIEQNELIESIKEILRP
jgi:cysteate synthase